MIFLRAKSDSSSFISSVLKQCFGYCGHSGLSKVHLEHTLILPFLGLHGRAEHVFTQVLSWRGPGISFWKAPRRAATLGWMSFLWTCVKANNLQYLRLRICVVPGNTPLKSRSDKDTFLADISGSC